MSDRERIVAEIEDELKDRARADPRPIREVVESALKREFNTAATAAIERRIDEKRQRIQTLEREINERERELAAEQDALERLQQQLETFEDTHESKLDEARETLSDTPRDPENPAIQTWAKELGMPPEQLIEEL